MNSAAPALAPEEIDPQEQDATREEALGSREPEPSIAEAFLLGDLMKAVLDTVKALPKPWQQLAEHEQDDYLSRIEFRCKSAVVQTLRILQCQEHVTVPAAVESVTFKDGIKAVLKVAADTEGRHALADAEGESVTILISFAQDLLHGEGKPVAEPDQRGLELGHEYDESSEGEHTSEDPQAQSDADDQFYQQAVDFVVTNQRASVNALQRELSIGYNRAARLVERMESEGIVSPQNVNGVRNVLRKPEGDVEVVEDEDHGEEE